jgi:hypothetical protein
MDIDTTTRQYPKRMGPYIDCRTVVTGLIMTVIALSASLISGRVVARDDVVTYQKLRVASPRNNSAFWNADGKITIKIEAQPNYGPRSENTIRVYMDKDFVGTGTVLQLNDVSRGTHSVYAIMVDAKGNTILKSSTIHFTLHKPSVSIHYGNSQDANTRRIQK